MKRFRFILFYGFLAAGAVGVGGCASVPSDRAAAGRSAALSRETFTVRSPALVFAAPDESRRGGESGPAWWASRNDPDLNVSGGQSAPSRTTGAVLHIEDRQRSIFGSIRNTYRRTFEATRYIPGLR